MSIDALPAKVEEVYVIPSEITRTAIYIGSGGSIVARILLYSMMDYFEIPVLTYAPANGSCDGILVDSEYWTVSIPPFYLPYSAIFPGQTRISQVGIEEKLIKAKERSIFDEATGTWRFQNDDGRSIYSMDNPVPVVKAPFGFIPADGHHEIRAGIEMGATTVAVKVIADLSHLSEEEFWREAEARGWAYLYNSHGERTVPIRSFLELSNDPYRSLAGKIARKYSSNGRSKGAEYPVWIKIGRDIPFIEFIIADALRQAGIVYDYNTSRDLNGTDLPEEFVEEIRHALLDAHIEGLKVVPERKHYSEISERTL